MGELLKKRWILVPPLPGSPHRDVPLGQTHHRQHLLWRQGVSVLQHSPHPLPGNARVHTVRAGKGHEVAWREISGSTAAGETEGRGWAESWEVAFGSNPRGPPGTH